ncbi:MAG TPA: bifunctional riboflavin kinase/FAD synthetase [Balneolales bacterium]|nr:bifunctional riboflavin kinase/FAD synthetase [Balneolales bacterium]
MTEIVYLNDIKRDPNTVLTVGTFDGVHEGHKTIIKRVVDSAKKINARSALITFDPHPREILQPGKSGIKLLTTLEERAEILNDLGISVMVVIPFDRDFSLLSSEDFIKNIIFEKIGVSKFVIGYDHQFGRNREGTKATVNKLGKELGFDVEVVEAHEVGEITVSSTTVRKALKEKGDVDLAKSFLGRPYHLKGTVIHGDKRGKKIGFPTANIKPENQKKIIPKNGVYAVSIKVGDTIYKGMMNIGVRPTFDGSDERTLEVNIFEFDQNIYGEDVDLWFIKRIRDEQRFNSVDELIAQINNDKEIAQRVNK